MRRAFILTILCSLTLAVGPAAFGLVGAGGCGSCTYPFDAEWPLHPTTTASTPSEAAAYCTTQLSTLPFHLQANGFVIRWLDSPPGPNERARFSCYACISNDVPDPFGGLLTPKNTMELEVAVSIAESVYGGEVTNATKVYAFDEETEQASSGFILTLTGVEEFEEGHGVVGVDPEDGECIRLHPINCEER